MISSFMVDAKVYMNVMKVVLLNAIEASIHTHPLTFSCYLPYSVVIHNYAFLLREYKIPIEQWHINDLIL